MLTFSFMVVGFDAAAQDDPNEEPKDSIKTGNALGKLLVKNPPSILELYEYDPISDKYIFTQSVNGFVTQYPVVLSPKEYERLMLKESIRNYYREKGDAIEGKKEGAEEKKKNLLPRYHINSSFFETLFGSNTIDIKPSGSVEMDLGIRYTKQDNPALSPRNRSTTTFDFQQRISMSLNGMVGTRLKVTANYDTQSTFAFQNLIKLEFSPGEDDIIQKIELGNVSMPLSNSLIRGAQSLFGVKMQAQFGRTTFTGIFSEQKSQSKTITSQGGGVVQNFELFALEYDADRHFFLSQYFRDNYDKALTNYPFINSRVQITRIEVWVTNKQNRVSQTANNLRNIVAIQDLGEAQLTSYDDPVLSGVSVNVPNFFQQPADTPPQNKNNRYDPSLIITGGGILKDGIRDMYSGENAAFDLTLTDNPVTGSVEAPNQGSDYAKIENARKLGSNDFTYHPQLGYISLQQKLSNDEVLAVAYQFTIGDQVYQVGEFGSDGVASTEVNSNTGIPNTQALVLKMLKSTLTFTEQPMWNLMMKNIYQIPGAYQLQKDDFRLNVMYTDPSPLNYITQAVPNGTPLPNNVKETPLLKVFNLDRLNMNNDPQDGGDGFFDYLPGLTIDQQYGRVIFTTIEPFGRHLFNKLSTNPSENYTGDPTTSYNDNQKKYVYRALYTKIPADALQENSKNKFQLKGKFKSTGGDGIPLGAFNVPKGSVVVTAGGRTLVEGIDYTVNYQAGRVQVLDPSLLASNTPIQVSLENNSSFGQQTRRFFGFNVEHKFSSKFVLNATYLRLSERPFTQKTNYGQESVNNTIFGFNGNFSTEVPLFTRLVNKLPNIDTDVPSNLSVRGEFAYLKPDSPDADKFQGETTVYVDNFEGSQNTIDMRSAQSWSLSSTPQWNSTSVGYNDFGAASGDLSYGFKRAKLSWYSIDPTFYVQRPDGVSTDDISMPSTRRIFSNELYPNTDIAVGQSQVVNTFDMTYYPKERGPYNYNPATAANNTFPTGQETENFGGIMRSLASTNFQQGNVEYIQVWMLDPYYPPNKPGVANPTNTGKVYFNLGEISEDVLKDGRKQYENGLPQPGSNQISIPTVWGKVPASQSLLYAFDADGGNRSAQDVGFDGLNDDDEKTLAGIDPAFAAKPDPAADNYTYYLSAGGNLLERYRDYNNVQGNSPVDVTDTNRGSSTLPDVEDINRDNTMNTINAYYEYKVDIRPNMQIGENYITDIRDVTDVPLPNGETTSARWIQFKIPISQPSNTVGGISGFASIRFMRMFMTGFSDQITTRLGALDLIRGEWRRYAYSLQPDGDNPTDDPTVFDVQSVNILENSQRQPISYVSPPGVAREQLYNNNTVVRQNEQSLSLRVSGVPASEGLEVTDARGVFKSINVDMRQYKKLKMFLHAESLPISSGASTLNNDEMIGYIRFGNDLTDNFYEVEIPLKVTTPGNNTPEAVWPDANQIDLELALLTQIKIMSKGFDQANGAVYRVWEDVLNPDLSGKPNRLRIGVRGNPNFGLIRSLMVGIRNNSTRKIDGEVWFNEFRMADMENKGGWAANMNVDTNFADFATFSATGKKSTQGFGTLEQGPQQRSIQDIQQYNLVMNLSLGKLLPKKWGAVVPFNYSVGEDVITPKFDPYTQDIPLQLLMDVTQNQAEKDNIYNRAIDYTKRRSINFIGVKKERTGDKKAHIYDPENITLSHSYNEVNRHSYELQEYRDQQVKTSVDYAASLQPKAFEPLKKSKYFSKSQYWKLLSDFNMNFLPNSINFNSNIVRQLNRQQFRQVDVDGLQLDPLYQRNYTFNYQYGVNYSFSKALKFNFTASNHNIVRNYYDSDGIPNNTLGIWDDYWNPGTPNQHNQQIVINYELPLNKLPFLSFVKSTYVYTGDYSWQRSSMAMQQVLDNTTGITYNLGNTIQNAASHKLNTALNMDAFYKFIGLKKGAGNQPKTPQAAPKPGEKVVNKPQPLADSNKFLDGLIGVLTSVKNIQVNFVDNQGTVLPGYLPGLGFFGTSLPTLGFVMGSQDDVRFEAAKKGWLTNYPTFNQNFTQVHTRTLDYTANIDLFPDFKIDITANRSMTENFTEQYDAADGVYHSRSPNSFGNFSTSTIMIQSSFRQSDEEFSSAFQDFRENRRVIANRLAEQFYGSTDYPVFGGTGDPNPTSTFSQSNAGYPLGFGKNNQQVLIPAFLSAYTGFGIRNTLGTDQLLMTPGASANKISLGAFRDIPLPNWNIKYTGLMRLEFFKEHFKRFSIQHAYKSSYTVNGFRSNLEYTQSPGGRDNSGLGNFINPMVISNINLVEQFNPLIKLDFEMLNSWKILTEIKKDRSLSMSFDNNLLTEVQGVEYVIGTGYRFKDVIFSTRLADNPMGIIKSDINIKADLSFRKSKTIVRNLEYDNNQPGGGQNMWSLKLTADYSFSKNLTVIFFYDHQFTKPVVSTSFPITNIRSGFTLRYNFGN
ncbi:MAG: cell surface protein SprA [Flavobacterium sp. BFFFF2]|nr:MAG: cell surface protein SprA [Flavobacterium sp. BFFFF2]